MVCGVRTQRKSSSQSQNLRPTRAVQASEPTRTRVQHSTLFFLCFIQIVPVGAQTRAGLWPG